MFLKVASCTSFSCREFARWKVRNTAIERRDLISNPVPLMPEFQRSMRLLGRRPSTQHFIDTIIKKYGTHILISATLGGKNPVWTTAPQSLKPDKHTVYAVVIIHSVFGILYVIAVIWLLYGYLYI